MSKKIMCLVVVLCLAGSASATNWIAGPALWSTGSWDGTTTSPPTIGNSANIRTGNVTIDSTVTATALHFYMGDLSPSADSTLTMTGGTFDIAGNVTWYGQSGGTNTWDLSGGTMSVAGRVATGWNVNTGLNRYINVSGSAYLDITGHFELGNTYVPATVSHLQLDGGTVKTSVMIVQIAGGTGTNSMDITGGKLIVNGNISSLAGATAYGGAGSLVFTYLVGPDTTEITAIPEPATIALLGLGGLVLLRKKRAH